MALPPGQQGSPGTESDGDGGKVGGDDDSSESKARDAAVFHLQELAQNITKHMNDAKSLNGELVDNDALYLSTLVQAAKAAEEVARQNTVEAQVRA